MSEIRIDGIHHVGVFVADLAAAERLLVDVLGLERTTEIEKPELRARYYECGNASVEAIEPRERAARAEGLGGAAARIHHLAFAVADFDATRAALAAVGVEATDIQVSAGRRTFWTLPETSGGLVIQFVECK